MTSAVESLFLFDFDGVLADSLNLYSEAVKLILERIGTPIVRNRADYLELFEGNFYESMALRGVDLVAFSRVAEEILPGIDYSAMKPFPGLIPVLSSLQKDHLLAVVSSNGSQAIEKTLSSFGFSPYFRDIFGSDFLFSKREKISRALSKYGTPSSRTYYIGDTTGDIAEAKAAGVLSVAVAWGWHSREKLAAAAPDFLIDAPQNLLALGKKAGRQRHSGSQR